jgi:hypothetical protein
MEFKRAGKNYIIGEILSICGVLVVPHIFRVLASLGINHQERSNGLL